MKLLFVSLLLAGIPPWVLNMIASPKERDAAGTSEAIVVTAVTTGGDEAPCIIKTAGRSPHVVSATGRVPCIVVAGGGTRGDGPGEHKVVRIIRKHDAEGRAWLGVSIGEVPAALAAQLGIEDRGILVLNVVEDSPADRAGIEIHDVILSVGGDAIEGDVGRAIDLIKSHKAGEEVELVVLRNGKEKTVSVELGSRADAKGRGILRLKGPAAELDEQIHTRAKILKRDDDDEWVLEDLGELRIKDLPKHLRGLLPESGSRSTQVYIHDDEKRIETKVERDGRTIVVSREGDGPITVTRTDAKGNETTAEYDGEDALREGDEEAYDLWKKVNDSVVVHLDIDGIDIPDIELPDIRIDLDADEWKERLDDWRSQWEEALSEAREAYEKSMEEWREQMDKWREGEGLPGGFKFPPLPMFTHKGARDKHPGFPGLTHLGEPNHTFEVQTDGTIEVHIRKGDSKLVQLYKDEEDLARRSPRLYEEYKELMESEDEQ